MFFISIRYHQTDIGFIATKWAGVGVEMGSLYCDKYIMFRDFFPASRDECEFIKKITAKNVN